MSCLPLGGIRRAPRCGDCPSAMKTSVQNWTWLQLPLGSLCLVGGGCRFRGADGAAQGLTPALHAFPPPGASHPGGSALLLLASDIHPAVVQPRPLPRLAQAALSQATSKVCFLRFLQRGYLDPTERRAPGSCPKGFCPVSYPTPLPSPGPGLWLLHTFRELS